MRGLLVSRGRFGVDQDRMLELEDCIAMDECVASGGTRLYAPPHGMKSSSRDSPGARPCKKFPIRAVVASEGSGRLKNSDLAKRWGCCPDRAWGPAPSPSSPIGSSAQNRLVSGKDMCLTDAEIGSEPARTTKVSRSSVAADSVPSSAPYTSTEAG